MRQILLAANIFSSLFLQITILICGFILPRAILLEYSSETNGLVNTYLQIIAFLELEIGAVVQSSLYKPLTNKDNGAISKIIVSVNRFFKRLALILLGYFLFRCCFFRILSINLWIMFQLRS